MSSPLVCLSSSSTQGNGSLKFNSSSVLCALLRGETYTCARLRGTIRRSGPTRARPVARIRCSPDGVRGMSVAPVWRPERDQVVSPWRIMKTRGVVIVFFCSSRIDYFMFGFRGVGWFGTFGWELQYSAAEGGVGGRSSGGREEGESESERVRWTTVVEVGG